jgi:hypothetical protein
MENGKPNKRLTTDKNYKRPDKTYQDMLTNQDIKEKLKEYKKCSDIKKISIGTHLRYFTTDPKTGEKVFRLGGTLNKIDPEGRFVILGNGSVSWSVQIAGTQFWQKLTEAEFKEELKKEIKKELVTETMESVDPMIEQENKELKKELKSLFKKFEQLEEENKTLSKKNEQLALQLSKIATEIKKEKKTK